MKNLPLPNRALVRQHLTVALEVRESGDKQHGYPVSEAELAAILSLYDGYDAASGASSENLKGLSLDEALRAAIYDGYELTQVGRRLASIRTQLFQGVERCPICGISPPRVLDHHLPKATYHPLAIYLRNLVPLCIECNQSKGASVSANPAQRFLHLYFENLPNERFLRVQVDTPNGGLIAEYGLDPAAELPAPLGARISYQLDRLRLNTRYAQEINSYLTSHTTALHMCFDALGNVGVREYLNRQATVEFAQFHSNHWRPLLLLALANHEAFCAGGFRQLLPAPSVVATAEPDDVVVAQ
jgi:hypothetical protein